MKYKAKAIPKNHYLTLAWYTCHMVDVHREGHSIPYHHTAHRSSQQFLPYTYLRIFFQRKLGPDGYACHMVDVHREVHSIPYHHTAHRSSQQSLPYTYLRIFFQRKLGPEEDVSPCLFN